MKKKKFMVAILLLLSLFMIGCGTNTSTNNQTLTKYEEYTIDNVKRLQSRMKDPSSFKLYSNVSYVEYLETTGTTYTYLFIDYGATNSYGGMVRDTYVIRDSSLRGNVDDLGYYSLEYKVYYAQLLVVDSNIKTDEDGNKYGVVLKKYINREKVMQHLAKY